MAENAVILAAGKGSRFKENGVELPKVLLSIGGLRLMERSVLTLHRAGVRHFRIVLGSYREQIREVMSASNSLDGIDVSFVDCPDYEKGNGVSFGAGASGFADSFLLTMCDHIFSPETIRSFVQLAEAQASMPALACDADLENVFDMDDATKVESSAGMIKSISKQLTTYDLVDTGLFFFPKGYGAVVAEQVSAGATSVSNIIQYLLDDKGVRAVTVPNAVWQDVDYPEMKDEAEKRLRAAGILELPPAEN